MWGRKQRREGEKKEILWKVSPHTEFRICRSTFSLYGTTIIITVQLLVSPTVKANNLTFFFLFFFLLQAIPFGKIPILEVDGVIIHQSLAIARYLARESGNSYLTIFLLCSAPAFSAQEKHIQPQQKQQKKPTAWQANQAEVNTSMAILVLENKNTDRKKKKS